MANDLTLVANTFSGVQFEASVIGSNRGISTVLCMTQAAIERRP